MLTAIAPSLLFLILHLSISILVLYRVFFLIEFIHIFVNPNPHPLEIIFPDLGSRLFGTKGRKFGMNRMLIRQSMTGRCAKPRNHPVFIVILYNLYKFE